MAVESVNDYQEKAFRTMSPGDKDLMVLHCLMGMAGESSEILQLENQIPVDAVTDELGDCMWYVSGLAKVLDIPLQVLYDRAVAEVQIPTRKIFNAPAYHACKAIEQYKKVIFYKRELDQAALLDKAVFYIGSVISIADRLGIDMQGVLYANILKLEKRYPDLYFDDTRANNVDKEAEAEAMFTSIVMGGDNALS